MNKLVKLSVVALGAFFLSLGVQAQQKLAHVNTAELLQSMPEVPEADKKVAEFGKSLEEQLKSMTTEYQTKVADFQAKQGTMTDPVKEAKIKEIQDIEKRITEFQQKANEDITKQREKLYAPILKKAEEAIKAVAKEKSYNYVFDLSQPGILYHDGGENILPLVKTKLGLDAGAINKNAVPESIKTPVKK